MIVVGKQVHLKIVAVVGMFLQRPLLRSLHGVVPRDKGIRLVKRTIGDEHLIVACVKINFLSHNVYSFLDAKVRIYFDISKFIFVFGTRSSTGVPPSVAAAVFIVLI